MATYLCKKPKSSASTCNTEGSTASSSPTSSVNLAQQQQQQQQQQQPQNNNNNAPKYGTLVPNRIFVGGISGSTTETELAQLFSAYGNVKATKVISDRAGVSKGYGFVTFETEEEAKRLMRDSECIVLKERKLNIAPAIKKQPFSRTYEAASPPAVPANAIFYQNGVPYTFHNGVAYFPASAPQPTAPAPMAGTGDPAGVYQTTYGPPPTAPTHSPATTAYPVIYPCTAHPTMYMAPQQFQYQPIPAAPTSQYIYTSTSSGSAIAPGTGPPGAQGTPMIAAPTAGTPPALTALPGQPYYTTTHLNPADIYYGMAATGQPYPAMMTNEGIIYETPPHTEASSNQSAEDSCSNSSSSDNMGGEGGGGGGGGGIATMNRDKTSSKQDDKGASNSGSIAVANRQDLETPVVSLLKLQQMSNEQEQNIGSSNFTKKYTSPPFNPGQNDFLASSPSMAAYFQQPPSMAHPVHANNSNKSNTLLPFMYHSHSLPHQGNPLYVNYMNQSSGTSPYTNQVPPVLQNHVMNGHADSPMNNYPRPFPKQRPAYNPKGYPSRRGGRGGGNNMGVNIPPFPAKLHMMNAFPGNNERQKRQYGGPSRGSFGGHRGQNIHNQGRFGGSSRMVRHNPRNTAGYFPGNAPALTLPSSSSSPTTTTTITTSAVSSVTTTATTVEVAKVASKASSEDKNGSTSEKQENISPPPAPYSPMTCPVILSNDSSVQSTSASPPQQVQFYPGTHQTTLYYQGSSNGTVVSQQLPVPSQPQPRRFLTTVTRKSGSNVSSTGNGGASDSSGKYTKNMVNGSLTSPGNPGRSQMLASVDEGSLGGAGDAPPLVQMTPPATPHCSSTVAANGLSQNQGQVLQETCHQMQALTL